MGPPFPLKPAGKRGQLIDMENYSNKVSTWPLSCRVSVLLLYLPVHLQHPEVAQKSPVGSCVKFRHSTHW